MNKSSDSNEEPIKAFLSHFNESVVKSAEKSAWYVDSGATEHMCNRIRWFQEYQQLQNQVAVTIGNGSKMYGVGRGNINVLTFTGEKWISKVLTKVLYVQDGHVNLFASNKASDNGHTMEANADLM